MFNLDNDIMKNKISYKKFGGLKAMKWILCKNPFIYRCHV